MLDGKLERLYDAPWHHTVVLRQGCLASRGGVKFNCVLLELFCSPHPSLPPPRYYSQEIPFNTGPATNLRFTSPGLNSKALWGTLFFKKDDFHSPRDHWWSFLHFTPPHAASCMWSVLMASCWTLWPLLSNQTISAVYPSASPHPRLFAILYTLFLPKNHPSVGELRSANVGPDAPTGCELRSGMSAGKMECDRIRCGR